METKPPVRGVDGRVWKNICFNARRLAALEAVPGMTGDDYRQDLALDLIRRSGRYDPSRASYPTFADRVIAHRAATLCKPGTKRQIQRSTVSLDTLVADEDGRDIALHERIADAGVPVDDLALAKIDIGRFIARLPQTLQQCCTILEGDGVCAEAQALGIHRATVHSRIRKLRAEAVAAGLDVYFARPSDRSKALSVSDRKNAGAGRVGGVPELPMSKQSPRPTLKLNVAEFEAWVRSAAAGMSLEYHRGFLPLDRAGGSKLGEDDAKGLDDVANAAMEMAEAGYLHLVQRRHGAGDYSYIAVVIGSSLGRGRDGAS